MKRQNNKHIETENWSTHISNLKKKATIVVLLGIMVLLVIFSHVFYVKKQYETIEGSTEKYSTETFDTYANDTIDYVMSVDPIPEPWSSTVLDMDNCTNIQIGEGFEPVNDVNGKRLWAGYNTSKNEDYYVFYENVAYMGDQYYDIKIYYWCNNSNGYTVRANGNFSDGMNSRANTLEVINGDQPFDYSLINIFDIEFHFYKHGEKVEDPNFKNVWWWQDMDTNEGIYPVSGIKSVYLYPDSTVKKQEDGWYMGTMESETVEDKMRLTVCTLTDDGVAHIRYNANRSQGTNYGQQVNKVNYQLTSDSEYKPNETIFTASVVRYGEYNIKSPQENLDNYEFFGWYTDETCTNKITNVEMIQADMTIYGKYIEKPKITTEVENGTIDPDIEGITKGANETISYKANDGYMLKSVTIDGATQDINTCFNNYTFENIQDDHHIKVVYEKIPLTNLSVEKIWDDGNNSDGIRPEQITITLLQNDLEYDTYILKKSDNWQTIVSDLPTYTEFREPLTYKFVEKEVPEKYKVSYITEGNLTKITNTYEPETINIQVNKIWDHTNNVYTIPKEIKIQLKNGSSIVAEKILNSDNKLDDENTWTWTFTNLPKYQNQGKEIKYTVDELEVNSGDLKYYKKQIEGMTIKNIYNGPIISAEKLVDKTEAQEGEKITYTIRINNEGNLAKEVTIIDTLPSGIIFDNNTPIHVGGMETEYTEQNLKDGIQVEVPANGSIDVVFSGIVDELASNQYSKTLINQATVDNEPTNEVTTTVTKANITAHKESDPASGSKVREGDVITYRIRVKNDGERTGTAVIKDTVPAGTTFVEGSIKINNITDIGKTSTDLQNGIALEIEKETEQVIEFKVKVNKLIDGTVIKNTAYINQNEEDEKLPEEPEHTYIEPKEEQSITKNGTTKIDSLNEEITYNISYTAKITDYQGNATIKLVDTLPYALDTNLTNITEDLDGGRYDETSKTITWEERVKDIQFTEEKEVTLNKTIKVVYKDVSQDTVNINNVITGYIEYETPDRTSDEVSANWITTTEFTVNIPVTKVWDDKENSSHRPESVTVQLTAEGKNVEGKTAVLNNNNEWKTTFEDLPKYDDAGKEINYSVVERETNSGELEYYDTAKVENVGGIVRVTNSYKETDSNIDSSIEKTGTEEITSSTDEVNYEINYNATVTDYIGEGTVTIVDYLPYAIDKGKSDIANGTYDSEDHTITWVEDIGHINTYEEGEPKEVNITKNIKVVFNGLDASKETMTNRVVGTINLSENGATDTVEDTKETNINIKGNVVAKYLEEGTNDVLVPEEEQSGKVGTEYSTEQKNIVGYNFVRTEGETSGKYIEGTTEVIYYYKLKDPIITTPVVTKNSSVEKVTNVNQSIDYIINYKTTLTDYKGKATVAIVDYLPYEIDESKAYNLDGGTYSKENKTITWTEEIGDIDTFDNGIYNMDITKEISLVYENIDVTQTNIENRVTGTIKLETPEKEETVEDTKEIPTEYLVNIPVTKIWEDNTIQSQRRPESVIIVLKRNGVEERRYELSEGTAETSDENTWTYTFKDLPKYDQNNNIIQYTVEEKEKNAGDLKFYTSKVDGTTITNTFIKPTDTISIEINKKWEDQENIYDKRPVSIILEVKAKQNNETQDGTNEVVVVDKAVTKENNWSATFTNLPKYNENGEEIQYTVDEEELLPNDLFNYEKEAGKVTDKAGTTNEKEATITNTMTKIPSKVVVKYVDKNTGEEISERKTKEGIVGDTFDVTEDKKDIEGYTLVEEPKEKTGTFTAETQEKIYYYAQNTSAKVQHIDRETGEILKEETENGKVGDIFETHPEDFEGYVLVESPEEANIVMDKTGEQVVKYYYAHVSAGVIEKHIDEITGELLESSEHEGNEGDYYNIPAKTFEGYDLVTEDSEGNSRLPNNAEGKMKRDEVIEVKYYYIKKAKVIVKYLEEDDTPEDTTDNKVLAEAEIIEGHENDSYETEEKEIKDYNLVEIPENSKGTMIITKNIDGTYNAEIEVIYYYKKKAGGVIENHIDITTGKKLATEEHKGNVGDPYDIPAREFEGYEIVTRDFEGNNRIPENSKGTMTEEEIEVNYYYIKLAKVRVEYIDEQTGERLDEEELNGYVGISYETEEKEFEGYDLVEKPSNSTGKMTEEEIVVKYYYQKKAEVEVKYLEKGTEYEIVPSEILEGHVGNDYETEQKDIQYYKFVEKTENYKGKMEEEKITVIYYYEKEIFNLGIDKWVASVNIDGISRGAQNINSKDEIYKVDIYRKNTETANIKVTYKIRVTNKGEIEGTAGEIVEIIPAGYSYHEEDNSVHWEERNGTLVTDALKEEMIQPGEYKEIEIVLRWDRGEENFGQKDNTVILSKIENPAGYEDVDKTDDNDTSSMIITVATGLDRNDRIIVIGIVQIVLAISVGLLLIYRIKRKIGI